MFSSPENFNRLGSSIAVHLLTALAGVILFHPGVHPVGRQQHAERLIFAVPPTPQPTPEAQPIRSAKATLFARAVPATVAHLSIGHASALPAARVEEQPRLAPLNLPGSVELPPSTEVHVTEAAQVTLGVFGSPAGNISGHSIGAVSQAGFGAKYAEPGKAHGGAMVVAAGFDVTPAPAAIHPASKSSQTPAPPVIVSEPAPVYSSRAKADHIQGTVDLRVKFRVDGSVEVLEIVNGLPGLNDSALAVARGIKFIPAASDFTTLIHVRFELADSL